MRPAGCSGSGGAGDSNLGKSLIHDVGTVLRAAQPFLHDLPDRFLAQRDVLPVGAPRIAGGSDSIARGAVVGAVMGEVAFAGHVLGMLPRRFGQIRIPGERFGLAERLSAPVLGIPFHIRLKSNTLNPNAWNVPMRADVLFGS